MEGMYQATYSSAGDITNDYELYYNSLLVAEISALC